MTGQHSSSGRLCIVINCSGLLSWAFLDVISVNFSIQENNQRQANGYQLGDSKKGRQCKKDCCFAGKNRERKRDVVSQQRHIANRDARIPRIIVFWSGQFKLKHQLRRFLTNRCPISKAKSIGCKFYFLFVYGMY